MEFDETAARSERSALLQQGAFYSSSSSSNTHQDQIAYDNPTARQDQIEREETPHRSPRPPASAADTPLSPPPSYDHALSQDRLYARGGEGPSTSQQPSVGVCPSQQRLFEHHSQCSTPQHYAVIGEDSITLDADDSFTAWQRSTGHMGSEIEISNKSSKQLFKLMAGMDGLCKMSSECRCDECQSQYFDTDFDHNDHEKTDGGLGAGTPMFLNEVLHGAACTIL